jgi:hypothetical protein
LKWALVVMLLQSIFIELPLILKNFDDFQKWFPDVPKIIADRENRARAWLAILLLLWATVQITLVFHSESLFKALRDHLRFLARFWWPVAWFIIVAAMHFYLFQVASSLVLRGLGEETAVGIAWGLIAPWLKAVLAAWLLASWVCLFKRCDTGRSEAEHLIQY